MMLPRRTRFKASFWSVVKRLLPEGKSENAPSLEMRKVKLFTRTFTSKSKPSMRAATGANDNTSALVMPLSEGFFPVQNATGSGMRFTRKFFAGRDFLLPSGSSAETVMFASRTELLELGSTMYEPSGCFLIECPPSMRTSILSWATPGTDTSTGLGTPR